MKKLFKKAKGFTLIELIVVIAILAILAAILIPSITNYITQANISKDQSNARSAYSAETLNYATNSTYDVASVSVGGMTCTITADAGGPITAFSCSGGVSGKTFTLANNFSPS